MDNSFPAGTSDRGLSLDSIESLKNRAQRLNEAQKLLEDHPELAEVLDTQILQLREKDSEILKTLYNLEKRILKREQLSSTVLVIVSMIAGWLLSLLGSPANIFHH